jgi:CRP-like cAMP-binding protein
MQLPSCYLFQGLPNSKIDRITSISRQKNIQKEKWLFYEGQAADNLYLLTNGAVELLTEFEETIELPVAIIRSEGGCFGIGALVPPYLYSLSARCVSDSSLLVIKQADILHLINSDPELGCTIMTNLAKKLLDRLKETRQTSKIHFKTLVRYATF